MIDRKASDTHKPKTREPLQKRAVYGALLLYTLLFGVLLYSSQVLLAPTASSQDIKAATGLPSKGSLPARQQPKSKVSAGRVAASAESVTVDDSPTALQLAQNLVGGGITITSASFNSSAQRSRGTFFGGISSIGFESGVILSSGDVRNVIGPNTVDDAGTLNGTAGDVDLNAIVSPQTTYDASVLQFTFVPSSNVISFQYVFGSEEYNEFVGDKYNDVFGFYVNGTNVALLPGTSTPVSINTVNAGSNSQYFRNNRPPALDTQLDGLTTILSVQAAVIPNAPNTIKLVVADTADSDYDSAVFIGQHSIMPVPATMLTVSPAGGTFGGTADLSAALKTFDGSPVSGRSILFCFRSCLIDDSDTPSGRRLGTATTDPNGVATLRGVSLAGFPVGSYPGAIIAVFLGDESFNRSSGAGNLTVTACAYGLEPLEGTDYPVAGGTGRFIVTTTGGCTWQATSDQPDWLVTSSTGTGPSDGSYTVQPNTTTSPREGHITVGGHSITITQAGIPPCPVLPLDFGQNIGGDLRNSRCLVNGRQVDLYSFTATDGQRIAVALDSVGANGIQPYIELIGPDGTTIDAVSGTMNAAIPLSGGFRSVAPGNYTIRVSTLGNAGLYNLSLLQQTGPDCSYSPSPAQLNVGPGGGTFFFDVLSSVGCPTAPVSLGANSGDLTINSNVGGRVTFSVRPNTGADDRTETILVGGPASASKTFTVKQFGGGIPPNDDFEAAEALVNGGTFDLPSGTAEGRNFNASRQPGEQDYAANAAAAHSVWYSWKAPKDGLYTFTTSGSDYDTVLAVYSGSGIGHLDLVAFNDDTTIFDQTSKVVFTANKDATYYIAIDGKNGAVGDIKLSFRLFQRLLRLYLQNFNGLPSPIVPDEVSAAPVGGGEKVMGTLVSLGVYEFLLPPDGKVYQTFISGPNGIVWSTPRTLQRPSLPDRAELSPEDGEGMEDNQISNPSFANDVSISGFITGYKSKAEAFAQNGAQSVALVKIESATPGGPSAVGPRDCPNPNFVPDDPSVPDGPGRIRYRCRLQPNSDHEIRPNQQAKAFIAPTFLVHSPSSGSSSYDGPPYDLMVVSASTSDLQGKVTADGHVVAGAVVKLSGGSDGSTTSGADGSFTFPNLTPGNSYTVKATLSGFVFKPESVMLSPLGSTANITGQGCTYTLTPLSASFAGNGGSGEFKVTANTSQTCQWTASQGANSSWISVNAGSAVGDGKVSYSVMPNGGASRTGTIVVGGQSFTVQQGAGAPPSCTTFVRFDFDCDAKADLVVRRPSNDTWYLLRSTAGYTEFQFGIARDMLAPADYDGDGRTDIAVFRPSEGRWYIFNSGSNTFSTVDWGVQGDLPVPEDFDGDHRADVAVFRASEGMWYRRLSQGGISNVQFGIAEDKPVIGDFDADGKADIAVYRPSTNVWYLSRTTKGYTFFTWGEGNDIAVPADYDGDNQTDLAVFRRSTGQWFVKGSKDGPFIKQWGESTDLPVAADYDGDGKADIAVFRPSNGTWYLTTTRSGMITYPFGVEGDRPAEGAFIY